MSSSSSSGFQGFVPLNNYSNVFLYKPADLESVSTRTRRAAAVEKSSSEPGPDLVILSTWMGAQPRHILKYVDWYKKLYPAATIMVQTDTVTDILLRPNGVQQRRLTAAVDIVRGVKDPAAGSSSDSDGAKILLHAFSNGGVQQAIQLAKRYRETTGTQTLPVSAMVVDSSPGKGGWRESNTAFVLATPPSLRWLARPIILLVIAFYIVYARILRLPTSIDWIRAGLVDDDNFPKAAPRVYIYSKTDKLVRWGDVLQAARDAEAKGWAVETVEFEGSAHVNHMASDPDRYWGAVKKVLATSVEM